MSECSQNLRPFRFIWSLRTMMALVAVVGVLCGAVMFARRPRPVTYRVEELGGNLTALVEPHDWSIPGQILNLIFGPFERFASPVTLIIETDEFGDDDLKAVCDMDTTLSAAIIKSDRLTDLGLETLSKCRLLHIVNIESNSISDHGLKSLGGLRGLREIVVVSDNVTGTFVAELHKGRSLETIELRGKSVDDRACPAIAKFDCLSTVVLSDTSITDAGLLEMAEMRYLGHLYVVNSKVTKEGINAFHRNTRHAIQVHSDFD